MCGDLEDYDPGKHTEILLETLKERIGKPTVSTASSWSQEIAAMDLVESNKELLAHFLMMGNAVTLKRNESEQLESIAQLAQVHAYLSGILTGLLLDDGALQQIGIQKFLAGFSLGREIDKNTSAAVAYGHSHGHAHSHDH